MVASQTYRTKLSVCFNNDKMMNEPIAHTHFIFAIFVSLFIHIGFILYGNINIEKNNYKKSQSEIELIIVEKAKKIVSDTEPKKTTSSSNINKSVKKIKTDEKLVPQDELIKINTSSNKGILEKDKIVKNEKLPDVEESVSNEINQNKPIDTEKLIANLSNLDISAKNFNNARVKTISANTEDYEYRLYFEAWRQKVERLGALNYPKSARQGTFGALRLTVKLNANGEIENITINKTSGNKELDKAAINIVKLGAPYAAFSERMRSEIDFIKITRKWNFTEESYSSN